MNATREMVRESGLSGISMDSVAARAGSSKATVYRWWPDKAALALDALLEQDMAVITFDDTGDLKADLAKELNGVARFCTRHPNGKALLIILGEAQGDRALAQSYYERIVGPACDAAKARLRLGRAAGQLRDDVDLDLVVNAIWGPLYHRLLVTREPVTPRFIKALLDFLEPALTPPS